MKKIFLILLTSSFFLSYAGDTIPGKTFLKHKFYFYWGYNRAYFSKTDLHFNGPNYDFTLYDLTASDRPSKFGWVYFNPTTFSVPQYNYRLGFFVTQRLSVSGGMDHMKYVIDQDQLTTISGIITPEASETYQGTYLHTPIQLTKDVLQFEHTNGFNLVSIDVEYLLPVFCKGKRFGLKFNSGLGGIWVAPKTDVRVFGDGLDNDFHVAGYSLFGKAGPRLEYKGKFFLAAETKCGYASLPYVLIKNSAPEVSDHNVIYYEWYIVSGLYFDIKFKGHNKRE